MLQSPVSHQTFLRIIITLFACALPFSGCQNATATPIPATVTSQVVKKSPTPAHEFLRITKYPDNFTAFKIETQDGITIITDPYMMDEQVHADIVTESHQHSDHTDISHILAPYTILNKPGQFELTGVKITGIAGSHYKPWYNNNIDNNNIIYVFDFGNIRLAQFASQGDVPTPAMFAQIGKVDILIIQIFTVNQKLSEAEVQQVVNELAPRIIIPAHGDPSLSDGFAQRIGADFRQETSGILNISSSDLDQLGKPVVVVLDH